MSLLDEAISFAKWAHTGQEYNGLSYWDGHLAIVVDVLAEYGFDNDEDVMIAGCGHDTFEDAGITPEEWSDRFGQDSAFIIWTVSGLPGVKDTTRRMRNADIYSKFDAITDPDMKRRVAAVKVADRVTHARAAVVGSSHWKMYRKEHSEFASHFQTWVPAAMWAEVEKVFGGD